MTAEISSTAQALEAARAELHVNILYLCNYIYIYCIIIRLIISEVCKNMM